MKKEMNNKGFSLVELIIVVAIMAVLVGVLAPQYIKYLDKSKVGADKQLADNLKQAITTTILDPDITAGVPTAGTTTAALEAAGSQFWDAVYGIMGVSSSADLQAKLKLEQSASIQYSIDTNKAVSISVVYNDSTYNFTVK